MCRGKNNITVFGNIDTDSAIWINPTANATTQSSPIEYICQVKMEAFGQAQEKKTADTNCQMSLIFYSVQSRSLCSDCRQTLIPIEQR